MAFTEYKDLPLKVRQVDEPGGPSRDGSGEADGPGALEEQWGPALLQHRVPWRGGDYDRP